MISEWDQISQTLLATDPEKDWHFSAALTKLKLLAKQAPFGVQKYVSYLQKGGYGRRYPQTRTSIAKMWGYIRDTLIAQITFDRDIDNAHYTFLSLVVEVCELECSTVVIDHYVANKVSERTRIANSYFDGDGDKAKQMLLKILYGGGEQFLQSVPDDFLHRLKDEVTTLKDLFSDTFPMYLERYRPVFEESFKKKHANWEQNGQGRWEEPRRKDPRESAFALMLMDFEDSAMMVVIDTVFSKYSAEDKYPRAVLLYMFDGGAFLRPEGVSAAQFQLTLDEAAARVKTELGATIKLSIKPAKKDLFGERLSEFIAPSAKWLWNRVDMAYDSITGLGNECFLDDSDSEFIEQHMLDFLEESDAFPDGLTVERINTDDLETGYIPNTVSADMAKYDTVLIKAPMGAGKTYQLYRFLSSLPPDTSVLVVGFRISLNNKYLDELNNQYGLGFESYGDISGTIDVAEHKRVVVQINSIDRVSGDYDVVVLDEVTYTSDMIFHFCESNAGVVMERLIEYVRAASRVIVMDAFLGRPHRKFFEQVRPHNMKAIQVTGNRLSKSVRFLSHGAFEHKLIKKLLAREKIFFITNHKKFIHNRLEPLLAEVWNNAEVLIITGDTKPIPKISTFALYDVVIISPAVVAGLSFDIEDHFDCTIAFGINSSAPAEIFAQMALRVRRTNDDKIFIRVQNFPSIHHQRWDFPSIEHLLVDYLGGHFKAVAHINAVKKIIDPQNADQSAVVDLLKDSIHRRMQSQNHFVGRMTQRMREQAFDVNTRLLNLPLGDDASTDSDVDSFCSTDSDIDSLVDGVPYCFGDFIKRQPANDDVSLDALRNAENISDERYSELIVIAQRRRLNSEEQLLKQRYEIQKWGDVTITADEPKDYVLSVLADPRNKELLQFNHDRKSDAARFGEASTYRYVVAMHASYQRLALENPVSMVQQKMDLEWRRLIACRLLRAALAASGIDDVKDDGLQQALELMVSGQGLFSLHFDQVDSEEGYDLEFDENVIWKVWMELKAEGETLELLNALSKRVHDRMKKMNNTRGCVTR